jgi:ring-1,2-phenylacetyl-CoA epoxidase subunit PaaB
MLPHPSADQPATHPGAAEDSGALEPYEVFRQEREGDPMRHGGSVVAPDPTLALHYARELYARRGESLRLWVVRRADIVELDDQDLLNPPLDRSYRKPGGYVMRDKLAQARERTGQAKRTASSGRSALAAEQPDRAAGEPAPEPGSVAEAGSPSDEPGSE